MIASYIQRLAKMVIKKTLYDITNIKKTTHNGKLDNSSVISNKSSFSNDNIIQSNDNVKFHKYYFVSKETLVTFKVSCKDKVIAYLTSSNKFSSSIPSYKRGAKLRKTSSSKIS